MERLTEKPITLADLRWGLKGNTDLIDKLECIKYYKTAKKIEKIRDKIKDLVSNENDRRRLLSINNIDELKKEIAKWNETNCMNILLKLNREGLIKIYTDILGYTIADLEELRGQAPRTSTYTPVQVVGGRKNKTYTPQQQEEFLKNKGLDDIIDFDTFQTKLIKKDKDELILTTPQKALIRKFAVGNEIGLIAIWGLGTGKTTLATLSTMIYLQIYPDSKVIFIAPASLLVNFVKTLDDYNVDIRDNRIEFYSYESYVRKKANCENALVIIDEAHNLRTPADFDVLESAHTDEKMKLKYNKGKRVGEIRRFCLNKARKILLLTGTPMVNTPYDIQTLMSMINQLPISTLIQPDAFYNLLNDEKQVKDYFSCKLSIFFNPKIENRADDPFPEKRQEFLYSFFPPEYEKAYDILLNSANLRGALNDVEEHIGKQKTDRLRKFLEPQKSQKDDDDEDNIEGNPKSFFNGVRRLVNLIDDLKVNSIINNILEWNKKHKNSRNVIYTGFIDSGVKLLQKQLKDAGLSSSIVMGGMGIKQKAEAVEKYNKGDLDVLLITKSGAEGLDLKKTTNLYLLDGVWNEALASQIIGRGVRYKSHHDLPLKDRFVNVYRVFMIKKDEENFGNKMKQALENPSDFETLFMLIKEAEDIKALGELNEKKGTNKKRNPNTFIFVNEKRKREIKEKKLKLKEQLKNKEITKAQFNEEYKKLSAGEIWKDATLNRYGSKEALIREYFGVDKVDDILIPTIDLRMFILSKSKQTLIDNVFTVLQDKDFVETIESSYCMTENEKEYEKQITQLMNSEEFKKRDIPSEEWKNIRIKIYSRIINKGLKQLNLGFDKFQQKKIKSPNVKLQQYFSPQRLIKLMIDLSGLKEDTREIVRILEPTAGDGAILKYLINNYSSKHRLFLRTTEIDPVNRDELKKVLKNDLDILYEEPDFMKLQISDAFDYVFMNPPFNLDNGKIKDLDFIVKAYSHLQDEGELMSIVYAPHVNSKEKIKKFEKEIDDIQKAFKIFYTTPKSVNFTEGGSGKLKSIPIRIVQIIKGKREPEPEPPKPEPVKKSESLIEDLPELKDLNPTNTKELIDNYKGWIGLDGMENFLYDYILDKHKNDCAPITENKKVLRLSLKNPNKPIFNFYGGFSLKDLDFDEGIEILKKEIKRCKKRFIPLPLQLEGHLNMLLIDIDNKTIERFEPHGDLYRGRTKYKDINEKMDKSLKDISNKLDLKYLPASEVCPVKKGFQSLEGIEKDQDIKLEFKIRNKKVELKQGGLCALWSFLYMDLRLSNPELEPKDIIDKSLFKKVPPQFEDLSLEQYNALKLRQLALSYIEKTINMDKDILNFFKNPPESLGILEIGKDYFKKNKEFLKNLGNYLNFQKLSPRGFYIWLYRAKKQQITLTGLKNPDKVDTYDLGIYLNTYLAGLYNDKLAEQKKAVEPQINMLVI